MAADVPGPLVEIPALGAARRHSTQAHGVRIPPRAQARKQAPRSTPSHTFPWTWTATHACRGVARNLGDRPDGCPGPLTPYIGDSRCRQKVPAKLVCGRYFFSLSTITRGYHHGLSRRLPAHASRPKTVSRSVISFAHTTLQKPPTKNQSRARERLEMFAPNKIRNTSRPVVSKHLAPRPVVVQNGRASARLAPRRISVLDKWRGYTPFAQRTLPSRAQCHA